ncbi:hypothetical protein HYW99_04210 [Candidatus Woesearchaeota archaeon]|nr:hypothetical protein [Candidatus Woesearchaeota archaeon]
MKRKKIIKKSAQKTELKIVKRKGHIEVYDERKVYGSCYFACRNAHLSELEAEKVCQKVCNEANKFVNKKKVVTSNEIFKFLIEELRKHNEDAAFLYETHRDVS